MKHLIKDGAYSKNNIFDIKISLSISENNMENKFSSLTQNINVIFSRLIRQLTGFISFLKWEVGLIVPGKFTCITKKATFNQSILPKITQKKEKCSDSVELNNIASSKKVFLYLTVKYGTTYSRVDPVKSFKGCLPQVLLSPFMMVYSWKLYVI